MSVLPFNRGNSAAQLALGRVTQQLERVTDELIRALFARTRTPSPELEARIAQLETRRDELHERLVTLEEWMKAHPVEAASADDRIAS